MPDELLENEAGNDAALDMLLGAWARRHELPPLRAEAIRDFIVAQDAPGEASPARRPGQAYDGRASAWWFEFGDSLAGILQRAAHNWSDGTAMGSLEQS